MHTKSNNIKLCWVLKQMILSKNFFKSLLQKYQDGLEVKRRGSAFVFDSVDFLE